MLNEEVQLKQLTTVNCQLSSVICHLIAMKKLTILTLIILSTLPALPWGFFGHKKINQHAVYLLPPQMLVFYKPHIDFLTEHAVDPDKRRYALAEEGPRHYIDMDAYGVYPFTELPRDWNSAVAKYTEDSLQLHGIVPWWVLLMQQRLTTAFKEKNAARILKLSADIGHYISDAHVPLHTSSNHNGQHTGQRGIHGFWESRIPELLADREWDFFIGKAIYIKDPQNFIWKRILESAAAVDTVLLLEKQLTSAFASDKKYAFENRNAVTIRQYSTDFTTTYNNQLKGMVERRMRQSIFAVASFWFTAWVNAGQPDLSTLANYSLSAADQKELDELNHHWRNAEIKGRTHD
jgi:hypothetical protein